MNRYKRKMKEKRKNKTLAKKMNINYEKYWKMPKLITKHRTYYVFRKKMTPYCDLTFRADDGFDWNITNVYNKIGRRKIEQMDKKYNYEWSNRNITFNLNTLNNSIIDDYICDDVYELETYIECGDFKEVKYILDKNRFKEEWHGNYYL